MGEPQILLLIGDAYRCEHALAEREAALLAADPACERHVLFGDELDPASFEIELQSASLFALGRHFVVRQVGRSKAAKAAARALDGAIPPETYVTLVASQLRATNAIFKTCKAKDAVVSLPAPRGRAVAAAVREILAAAGLDATPAAIRRLVFRNGGDLLGVSREAEKLRSLAPEGKLTEEIVDRLVFPCAERTVYPFFDRLGERSLSGALSELATLRDDRGRLLGGAIRHLARLATIRTAQEEQGTRRRLAEAVGLPDWLCRRLADQAKRHTLDDLARSLRLGIDLDLRMKRGEVAAADALLELVFAATTG